MAEALRSGRRLARSMWAAWRTGCTHQWIVVGRCASPRHLPNNTVHTCPPGIEHNLAVLGALAWAQTRRVPTARLVEIGRLSFVDDKTPAEQLHIGAPPPPPSARAVEGPCGSCIEGKDRHLLCCPHCAAVDCLGLDGGPAACPQDYPASSEPHLVRLTATDADGHSGFCEHMSTTTGNSPHLCAAAWPDTH